jgi:ankyrin repeat protein
MTSEEASEDRASLNKQLLEASSMGDRERIRRLLEEGADVNARDGCGSTPLHYAVFNLNVELIKLLLKKGATF